MVSLRSERWSARCSWCVLQPHPPSTSFDRPGWICTLTGVRDARGNDNLSSRLEGRDLAVEAVVHGSRDDLESFGLVDVPLCVGRVENERVRG